MRHFSAVVKGGHLHFAFLSSRYASGGPKPGLGLEVECAARVKAGLPAVALQTVGGRQDEAYQWPSGPGATKDLIEVIALKVLMNFPRQ